MARLYDLSTFECISFFDFTKLLFGMSLVLKMYVEKVFRKFCTGVQFLIVFSIPAYFCLAYLLGRVFSSYLECSTDYLESNKLLIIS